MLQNRRAIDYRKSFVGYGSNALFLPTVFCHTIVKQLSSADVTSRMLKLNCIGFCQSAFPAEPSEITFVDYLGYPWKLLMDLCHDGDVSCVFSGEWQAMCNARMLVEGSNVKFGVT